MFEKRSIFNVINPIRIYHAALLCMKKKLRFIPQKRKRYISLIDNCVWFDSQELGLNADVVLCDWTTNKWRMRHFNRDWLCEHRAAYASSLTQRFVLPTLLKVSFKHPSKTLLKDLWNSKLWTIFIHIRCRDLSMLMVIRWHISSAMNEWWLRKIELYHNRCIIINYMIHRGIWSE